MNIISIHLMFNYKLIFKGINFSISSGGSRIIQGFSKLTCFNCQTKTILIKITITIIYSLFYYKIFKEFISVSVVAVQTLLTSGSPRIRQGFQNELVFIVKLKLFRLKLSLMCCLIFFK